MKNRSLRESFTKAIDGLVFGIKYERNIKIQILITGILILFMLCFHFSLNDILVVLLWIGVVISAEYMNTAIEKAMDFINNSYSPQIKIVKDLSASAVFILSLLAFISGILIFIKYIKIFRLQ
uniref:Diacylglycerol kinase family protein n=1 Tax=Dictyoglomus thermophilum TaxID=14 RepID=A0A7C3RWU9_DICTH